MGSSASKSNPPKNKTNNSGGEEEKSKPASSSTQTAPQNKQKTDNAKGHESGGNSNKLETDSKTSREDKAQSSNKQQAEERKPDSKATQPVNIKDSDNESKQESKATQPVNVKDSDNDKKPEGKVTQPVNVKYTDNDKKQKEPVDNMKDKVIDEGPKEQMKFDAAMKSACLLMKQDSILKTITKNVTKLQLGRAPPLHFSLPLLLNKFDNLKDLDLSNNKLGPQGFRAVCLAMCGNSTILSLNLADNMSDTDSADSLGKLVEHNQTLQYLDVSSNYLGKDYFCKKVGPALKTNTSLRTLRCSSIGTTDAQLFIDGFKENSTLADLDFSNNYVADSLGFAKGLTENLKKDTCVLTSLALGRCDMKVPAVQELQKGLSENQSLCELNLKACEFESFSAVLEFIITAARHPMLQTLCLDSIKVKSKDIKTDLPQLESPSSLQVIGLNACGLTDAFFTSLGKTCKGKLLSLVEIDLTANEELSTLCIDSLADITTDEDQGSSLRQIRFGQLSKGEDLPEKLLENRLSSLQYINLRNCRLSPEAIGQIGQYVQMEASNLSTIILDGLKLSKTGAVAALLANTKSSPLSTLSISGSALDDADLSPLFQAIKSGLQLHMLKLSANRITDEGATAFVEAMLANKKHPLAVVDFSNNRLEDKGAEMFSKLFTSKSHTSSLHSLNLSSNNIGKAGLLHLVSVVGGKSTLQALYVQGQSVQLDELHMIEIFQKLATSLGYKTAMDGDKVKAGCSDIPSNLPDGLIVKMTGLGGQTGNIGQALDSQCIQTDYIDEKCPTLNLQHVMQICCYLKGLKTELCVWSEEHWNMIIGADKATTDTPSWLKITEERDKGIYLSNLPGNTTQQKVDAMLEMEADCNLNEACLMKDPVTRSINGVAWAVMADQESVQKAVDYFNAGEARIFGQPIMISGIKVKVDNEANAEQEKLAVADQEDRQKQRAKEAAAHRTLIARTAEESWKRHAYRLAHPAYADGRIW